MAPASSSIAKNAAGGKVSRRHLEAARATPASFPHLAFFSTGKHNANGGGNDKPLTTTSSPEAPSPTPLSNGWRILLTLMGYYGKESTAIRQSQTMFRTCLERSAHPSFVRYLGLTEDFVPLHQILLLHVWIINRRLLGEGKTGKLVQETFFDTLWENTERRLRAIGIHEISINKQLTEVQKWSFGALVAYDIGYKSEGDGNQELGRCVVVSCVACGYNASSDCVCAILFSCCKGDFALFDRLTLTLQCPLS